MVSQTVSWLILSDEISWCNFFHFQGCEVTAYLNDGYCEDQSNNEECNYDEGDCCGDNVNIAICDACICYPHETCSAPLDLIADGYCNDETNNAECNFDGGDCCGLCVNSDHCFNCLCHAESPIDPYCKYFTMHLDS